MERKVIDCPETQTREEIELERTPCGVVISGCSRFGPRCAVDCGARCAVVVDEQDRRDVDDLDPRVLVVYAGHRRTKEIAESLAIHLSSDRLTVTVVDVDDGVPPVADYDAVVVGSFVRRGHHPRSVLELVLRNRDTLAAMPAFFFSVGDADDLHREWREPHWLPNASAVFEAPRDDDGLFRSLVSRFRPNASANDSRLPYTAAVREFALTIAEHIPSPELVVSMSPAK